MKDWIPVLSMFASGIFGAAIALITAHYSIKRINHEDKVRWQRSRIEKTEATYEQLIASISRMVSNALALRSNRDLGFEELHSRVELMGSDKVVKALNEWIDAFNKWAENHISGSPQKIGASDYVMIASWQSPYREEARNLYPTVHKAGRLLIRQRYFGSRFCEM